MRDNQVEMSRIKEKFEELEKRNEKALISYIMLGFPNEKATMSTVRGLGYVISMSGISVSFLIFFTMLKNFATFVPF